MNEILFRGKRADGGGWNYGYFVKSVNDRTYIISYATEDAINTLNEIDFMYNEVIPESVGQYVGKTDKNGVKIFGAIREDKKGGDIILLNECRGETPLGWNKYIVFFKDGCFGIDVPKAMDLSDIWEILPIWMARAFSDDDIEIIGNAFENENLLKEENHVS